MTAAMAFVKVIFVFHLTQSCADAAQLVRYESEVNARHVIGSDGGLDDHLGDHETRHGLESDTAQTKEMRRIRSSGITSDTLDNKGMTGESTFASIGLHDHRSQQGCSQVGPQGPPFNTNCPTPKWVDEMVRTDPSPGKTIVNIGCNKGNDAVRWMELWDMSAMHFWSEAKWDQHVKAGADGGFACPPDQGYVTASSIVKSQATEQAVPTGVCVEPMPANVRLLKEASQALGYHASTPHGSFHVLQAAVVAKASPNETAPFPDLGAGFERGSLNDNEVSAQTPHVQVPVKTVDTIMESLGLHGVDILSIDTEGYDAEVLKGAKQTLAKVRYVEFEVHRDLPPWSTTSLKSVVSDLDQQGFDCYWAGNNGQLTHIQKCWTDNFEQGTWANAACVKRGDAWSGALQKFSV